MEFATFGGLLGSSIESGEITDGAVTYPKLGNVNKWELLETLTPSTDATVTTGALTAKSEYRVEFVLTSSASVHLELRINGDTGGNYGYAYINNTTPTVASSNTQISLGSINATTMRSGSVTIAGLTIATAGGIVNGQCNGTGLSGGSYTLNVSWVGGNAVQITDFTLFPDSGTITGTIKVYGR